MFGANYFGSIYFGQAYPSLTVGVPVWVTPLNGALDQLPQVPLVFLIPQSNYAIHFELELDTANTFATGNLQDTKSWVSQTGWEYFNGASWVAIPASGIDPSFAGSQARFTPQTALTATTWYRRIRGRVVAF